jgi:hypothetical protein
MPFKDYSEVAEPPLTLPINGKEYAIPPVGAGDGLRLNGAFDDDDAEPISNDELYKIVLGPAVITEMLRDNVPGPAVDRAAITALADFREGRAVAEMLWETGTIPERQAAYMAAKQAEKNSADSTPSPSSDEADSTQPPASTSSTTSRKATPRKRNPRKSAASPGRGAKSSTSSA